MATVQDTCHEMAGELCEMVGWWSGGGLTPEQFSASVAELERRKLAQHGFKLSSAISEDGMVHFSLRYAGTEELCASLDVDPKTGKLEIQHTTTSCE